ncbi:PEP-CTERM sorting domain-containing protein [Chamaesiphon sp.]|uniref:PEP-CTERM sorting domain-containing protein n=1 Tax=Chamaesiphon sp. TaxID=2814140 RepID=UPI003593C06B
MQVKQFNTGSNSTETSPKSNSLTQMFAIGTLAIGASVGIAAAPAHAVRLDNGALTFTGATSDFFANASNPSFTVNFSNNIPPIVSVSSATGDFGTSGFPTNTVYGLNSSPSATFTQVGSSNTYTLNSDLIFAFTNGTSVKAGNGSQFLRTFNGNSVGFAASGTVGTTVSNSFGTVNTDSFNMNFNDISSRSGAGGYSVLASTFTETPTPPPTTAVPEPFTIIGTLVGGTAAVRMRKKLAVTQK